MAREGTHRTAKSHNRPTNGRFSRQLQLLRLLAVLAVPSFVFFGFMESGSAMEVKREGNHIHLSGFIAEDSPGRFGRAINDALLDLALSGDQDSAIELHLDLPRGGFAASSFELIKLIRAAQAHGTRFVAHVDAGSTCMSGCTFLFLAADERWISPEGRLIFHGFSQSRPNKPVPVPESYKQLYYRLLIKANEPFYRFFRHSRIVEDDIKVGFTGQTLHERSMFAGLITGLLD